jgi:hypothetical protein
MAKPFPLIHNHSGDSSGAAKRNSTVFGRAPHSRELVALIGRMAAENPPWSRRRIAAELAKLGHNVAQDTVAKYMPKQPGLSPLQVGAKRFLFRRRHPGHLTSDALPEAVPPVTEFWLYRVGSAGRLH